MLPSPDVMSRERLRQGLVDDLPRMIVGAILLLLLVWVASLPWMRQWLAPEGVTVALALLSVAVGVASALACVAIGEIHHDFRGVCLGVGIGLYSLFGIPAASFGTIAADAAGPLGNVRFGSHLVLVALTFVALSVPAGARPLAKGWGLLGLGVVAVTAAAGFGVAFPAGSVAITTSQGAQHVVVLAWLLSGLCLVAVGWLHREQWLSRAGWGCLVIAVAHVVRVTAGSPYLPFDAAYSTLHLSGLVMLLAGTGGTAWRALLRMHDAHSDYEEMLRLTDANLWQVEQRVHDVRNGLAGLAGVTSLFEAGDQDDRIRKVLRDAVRLELTRLEALLRPADADAGSAAGQRYAVQDVLNRQMVLQSSSRGLDVVMHCDAGLETVGDPSVLAQVMTNLFENCARHAPGSPVWVYARNRSHRIQIRVRDVGPGVPPGSERQALERGTRGRRSPGQGLGLYTCRELLAAENGSIAILPTASHDLGCTVVIELVGVPVLVEAID